MNSGFVAEDPDRAWHELGPYLLHDARMYAEWLGEATTATRSSAATVEALKRDNRLLAEKNAALEARVSRLEQLVLGSK